MARRSVLITGSSGTIGTALSESLLDLGYDVICVDTKQNRWLQRVDDRTNLINLNQEKEIDNLPTSIDLIVHLAANARVHKLVENPTLARENFDTTFNVLEFARGADADLIFASSREVYGNKRGQIIFDETDTYVDECESPYTASKIGGEALAKSYGNCYGIQTSIVRFSNVYGKFDASNRVIPLFIAQASKGEDLTVFGKNKVLDFTYIDDCISGLVRMIEQFNKAVGTTFNIASGRGTSLVDVAQTVIDITDSNAEVMVEPNRTGEVARYVADISKANRLLNYSPYYDIESGIRKTISWYTDRAHLFEDIPSP